jgi:hypothetical protein
MQRIIDVSPQHTNYETYNNETLFRLENFGLIKMMFLIFDAYSSDASDVAIPLPSSPYLIESVTLESEGSPIGRVDTTYTLSRLDELSEDLYKQVGDGCNFPNPLDESTARVSLPLYFSAIDGHVIDALKYTNLWVRCLTRSDFASMGLDKSITITDTKLRIIYDQPRTYVPIPLKIDYNSYPLNKISLVAGSTEYTVKMNVPYDISNIYFMIDRKSVV